MGFTGKTLSVLSDTITLETFEKKNRERKVVFARLEGDNRRRLFRALCPSCKAWHPESSARRRGPRSHTFACMTCGHEHGPSAVCRGAEVK